jgi:hypothetical protein
MPPHDKPPRPPRLPLSPKDIELLRKHLAGFEKIGADFKAYQAWLKRPPAPRPAKPSKGGAPRLFAEGDLAALVTYLLAEKKRHPQHARWRSKAAIVGLAVKFLQDCRVTVLCKGKAVVVSDRQKFTLERELKRRGLMARLLKRNS